MCEAADLYPGQSKTARTIPHTLPTVDRNDEVLSALKMLSGLDDDIDRDCTRTVNRLRSILVQIYASPECVFAGKVLQRTFVLDLLIHHDGPITLKKSGRTRTRACNHSKNDPETRVDDILRVLGAQTVTVTGTGAA